MITFIQFKKGAIDFLEGELVSKITNPIAKVGVLSSLYVIDKKATNIFNDLRENKLIKSLNVIDANGNIDDELLIEALKSGMKGQSVSFETGIIGTVTILPTDLDKFKDYIKTIPVKEEVVQTTIL